MKKIINDIWVLERTVSSNGCPSFDIVSASGELIANVEEEINAKVIVLTPEAINALMDLQGIEAFISDPKMKELFQKKVYGTLNKL